MIKASFRKLQSGWFQLHVSIANQAPYAVVVDELKSVKPRVARLMALKQVSTRKGELQVWSHPTTEKATTSIPLDLISGRMKPATVPLRARPKSRSPSGCSRPRT